MFKEILELFKLLLWSAAGISPKPFSQWPRYSFGIWCLVLTLFCIVFWLTMLGFTWLIYTYAL